MGIKNWRQLNPQDVDELTALIAERIGSGPPVNLKAESANKVAKGVYVMDGTILAYLDLGELSDLSVEVSRRTETWVHKGFRESIYWADVLAGAVDDPLFMMRLKDRFGGQRRKMDGVEFPYAAVSRLLMAGPSVLARVEMDSTL